MFLRFLASSLPIQSTSHHTSLVARRPALCHTSVSGDPSHPEPRSLFCLIGFGKTIKETFIHTLSLSPSPPFILFPPLSIEHAFSGSPSLQRCEHIIRHVGHASSTHISKTFPFVSLSASLSLYPSLSLPQNVARRAAHTARISSNAPKSRHWQEAWQINQQDKTNPDIRKEQGKSKSKTSCMYMQELERGAPA